MSIFSKNKKSSLFLKYLVSYLIILLIPLVFTSVFVFGYFNAILKNKITNNNLTVLEHVKNVVDEKMWEFKKISTQISNNYKLRPYTLNKSTTAKIEALQELKNYSINSDFIYNIILYVKGDEVLYSASGTYGVHSFIDFSYKYQNWGYEDFYYRINNLDKPTFRYSENVFLSGTNNTERFITYLVPDHQSTIIFLIDEKKLKNLLTVKSEGKCENTIVVDESAKIVTSTKDNPYFSSQAFHDFVRNMGEKGIGVFTIDKKNYFYSYVKSGITGWRYVTLIPEREALKSVYDVSIMTFSGWILIFILGGLIIYRLTYYTYDPIKNLRKLAEEKYGHGINGSNEIEVVKSVINKMANSGVELKKCLDKSRIAVKESLLLELLKGQVDSREKFNSVGDEIGITFTNQFYLVCIFSSNRFKSMKYSYKLGIIEKIENSMPNGIEGFGKDGINEHSIIFILSVNKKDQSEIKKVLQNVQNEIINAYELNTTVGIGNIYEMVSQVGKSYLEASVAIDYKFILGENRIIFFNEVIIKNSHCIPYPERELRDIQLFIKQGNIIGIENLLKAIVKNIKENDMPIIIARCICFDIINSVLKTVNELDISSIMTQNEYYNIETLNSFNTVEELAEIIRGICADLCNDIRGSKESQNFDLKDRLIQYIEENYNDQNFSVKALADRFCLSQAYLSRFFKDQTGETISDYLFFLRIERAKYYLKATDEPIKNVIAMIGYSNEASFVRLFKRTEGITPGEFRRLSKRVFQSNYQ